MEAGPPVRIPQSVQRFLPPLKEVHSRNVPHDPRKEREVLPKTTETPTAVPEMSLEQKRNPAAIRKAVLSEKDVVKERKNGRCF